MCIEWDNFHTCNSIWCKVLLFEINEIFNESVTVVLLWKSVFIIQKYKNYNQEETRNWNEVSRII